MNFTFCGSLTNNYLLTEGNFCPSLGTVFLCLHVKATVLGKPWLWRRHIVLTKIFCSCFQFVEIFQRSKTGVYIIEIRDIVAIVHHWRLVYGGQPNSAHS